MSEQRPSRKARRKRYELSGEQFEGFWFEMKPLKYSEDKDLRKAGAKLKVAGEDDDETFDAADAVFRVLCDERIGNHNFVDPDDNPLPIGDGLFAAIDSELLLAILARISEQGELPKAESATS